MTNVAVIGAGIGAQHVDAFLNLPNTFNVLHLIDMDTDRATQVCKGTEINVSASISDALQDASVDVIDVCLPPHLHVEITLQALAAGKHVICEKPIATSLADAELMLEATRASGKNVYPVFQYRWGSPILQMRRLIDSGLAGKPQLAAVETHWSRGADYYAVSWRGTWEGERGGAVLGHAIHNHDLLCHLMGDISAVSAATATRANPIETEDCAAILFEMESGALATSSVTLGAATNETRLRFVYENVMATSGTEPYAPGSQAWTFEVRTPHLKSDIETSLGESTDAGEGFSGFFSEIARDLQGKQNSAVTLKDGIRSIELVTAIYQAARTGDRVSLPLTADHPLWKGWIP